MYKKKKKATRMFTETVFIKALKGINKPVVTELVYGFLWGSGCY